MTEDTQLAVTDEAGDLLSFRAEAARLLESEGLAAPKPGGNRRLTK
jgi:hypothetical protein